MNDKTDDREEEALRRFEQCIGKSASADTRTPAAAKKVAAKSKRTTEFDLPPSALAIMNTPAQAPAECLTDRLPGGLLLIVGKPKCRKSFLALQLGLATARGTATLGATPKKGRVLALLLEDNDYRVRQRLEFFGVTAASAPENLNIYYQWPTGAMGCVEIEQWLERWPDTTLIIVDVLQRLRGPKDPRQGVYEADYQALSLLKAVLGRHPGLTILVVHHVRKGSTDDPVEAISGSFGIAGAADNYLIFTRRLDEARRFAVHIGGRDWTQWEDEFAWEFRDREGWVWLGPIEQDMTSRQDEILAFAQDCGGKVTPSMVADKFGISKQAAHEALQGIVKKGSMYNAGRGYYHLSVVTVP